MDDREAAIVDARSRCDGCGITIEREQPAFARKPFEDRAAMATAAEGAIDIAAIATQSCNRKSLDGFVEQNGAMDKIVRGCGGSGRGFDIHESTSKEDEGQARRREDSAGRCGDDMHSETEVRERFGQALGERLGFVPLVRCRIPYFEMRAHA